MYDIHGPAEDDQFEKYSVDSLENADFPLKSTASFDKGPVLSSEPFHLHGEGYFTPKPTDLRGKKLFEDTGKNPKLVWNCDIDENVLISKGLHLKEDGSFCKSPREKLPFIMPATKVAQIRWKKQVLAKKNSQDDVSWNEFKGGRSVQNITDCVRSSNDDISRLKTRENLTDSMKEALCETYKKSRYHTQGKTVSSSGKGIFFLPKFEKPNPARCGNGKQKSEESLRKSKTKNPDLKFSCEQKTKLSYYERYQKKNGFDPESISKKSCKLPSDSVRSILGDLTRRETLSEVSGDFVSDEVDDSEESFYEKVIARERLKIESLAEEKGEIEEKRKEEVKVTKTPLKKITKNGNHVVRPPAKNTSLTVLSGRKSHRLCVTSPESLPKGELASKARAYGNLANTRNMAKLQMKSLKEDRNRALLTSSAPSSELSDTQMKKSENSRSNPESWEWKSFLPRLIDNGKKEVDLPWETRNLLMQISAERDHFKQNMDSLKSRITAKERIWFDKEFGCQETMDKS